MSEASGESRRRGRPARATIPRASLKVSPKEREQAGISEVRALVGERMEKRLDDLTDAMLAGYVNEIAAYESLGDEKVRHDVRAVTRMHLELLLGIVVSGEAGLGDPVMSALRVLGSRRAEQGFPLHAVLRAYQVGTRIAWQAILEELAEVAGDPQVVVAASGSISTAMLDVTARISEEVSRAFVEAQERVATTGERARRAMFEELMRGVDDDDAALRQAAEVGYRLGRAHAVVAARAATPEGSALLSAGADLSPLDRETAAALAEIRPTGADPIVDGSAGSLYAIVVVDEDTTVVEVASCARSALAGLRRPTSRRAGEGGVLAAIGNVVRSVKGIAESRRQATQALDVLCKLGSQGPVATYNEMLPYLLVGADPALMMDLYRSTIGLLVEGPSAVTRGAVTRGAAAKGAGAGAGAGAKAYRESPTELAETLEAYLDAQGNLRLAAERLFVHRHTVTARLARIERLTGIDVTDPRGVFNLKLGLCAWELLRSGGFPARRSSDGPGSELDQLSTSGRRNFDISSIGMQTVGS